LRALWFDYLDTIEPVRPKLHAYCLRLTGSIWDAEDLIQDALLRGFGAIGRSDMNNFSDRAERQWFDRPEAYLSQIATNLWIDQQRRRQRETLQPEIDTQSVEPAPIITPATGAALFARAAPQERAAVVLKDVFDFSLDEIAGMLATTAGAVKSALYRGRAKLGADGAATPARHAAASPNWSTASSPPSMRATCRASSTCCSRRPRGKCRASAANAA
jgi:RNA polymerase sigma-70 factor (ECF subfamily)